MSEHLSSQARPLQIICGRFSLVFAVLAYFYLFPNKFWDNTADSFAVFFKASLGRLPESRAKQKGVVQTRLVFVLQVWTYNETDKADCDVNTGTHISLVR